MEEPPPEEEAVKDEESDVIPSNLSAEDPPIVLTHTKEVQIPEAHVNELGDVFYQLRMCLHHRGLSVKEFVT